jgi:hypothetical protein
MPFSNTLMVDELKELTPAARVSTPDGLKTDSIREYTPAAGITLVDAVALSSTLDVAGDLALVGALDVGSSGTPKLVTAWQALNCPGGLIGVVVTVDYSVLTAAATTQTVTATIPGLPGGNIWFPQRAFSRVVTPFAASGLASLTWTVGWAVGALPSDPDALLLTGDSDGMVGAYYQQAAAHKGVALDASADYPPTDANPVSISFTSSGANLNTLSAGSLQVFVWYTRLPAWSVAAS